MIDIIYPTKPPPTFVRKGFRHFSFGYSTDQQTNPLNRLTIDDDGIYIEERPVTSLEVFRVRRVLWPSALTMSLWSFTGALMRQNAAAIAKALGYEPKNQPHTTATVQQTIERIQQQLQKPHHKTDSKSPSPLTQTKSQVLDPSSSSTSSPPPSSTAPGSPTTTTTTGIGGGGFLPPAPGSAAAGGGGRQRSAREIYAVKVAQEHTHGPWQAFRQRMAQTWRPLHDYPPRGSISVSGVVELDTPRARITLEAFAWWDPKAENFDSRSLYIRWRSVRPKMQNPLR